MMSLVGCSEPEMAHVMSALGYRVHPPSDEYGPLHAFSVKPRFVREREEQRERQRQQQSASSAISAAASGPSGRTSGSSLPMRRVPTAARMSAVARPTGPPNKDRAERWPPGRAEIGRAKIVAGRVRRAVTAAGPRSGSMPPPRRRAIAAADSPFAKLLELKLGGKK